MMKVACMSLKRRFINLSVDNIYGDLFRWWSLSKDFTKAKMKEIVL